METITFNQQIWSHSKYLQSFAFQFTRDVEDANDLFQDTMVKAIRYSELFKDGTNLKGWLATIMRNTFINNYRQRKIKLAVLATEADVNDVNQISASVRNDSVKKFVMDDIKIALMRVPENYRTAFIRYFEGYKYQEIAEQMEIPIGTVKTWIHVARSLLKKQLQQYKITMNGIA